jgi:polyhydroxyalkanoate synthesis repressor PhaR
VASSAPKAQDPSDGEPDRRLVKRYANRKLYDTRDSRYVTLQQIAEYVRAGEDVHIIDNTTKEDLTNVTLAQIIYEEEKKGDDGRGNSARNLRNMIQEGRDRLMESLREGPMGRLLPRDEAADDVMIRNEETYGGVPSSTASNHHHRTPKEMLDGLHRLADEQVRALVASAIGHVRELQAEVRRLQARIEELEDRLKSAGRRRRESERPPPE